MAWLGTSTVIESMSLCVIFVSKMLVPFKDHFIKVPSKLPSEPQPLLQSLLSHSLIAILIRSDCICLSHSQTVSISITAFAQTLLISVSAVASEESACLGFRLYIAAGQRKSSDIKGGKANHEHRGLRVTLGQHRPLKTLERD